jgi:Zn-dependent M28 family amino/carboxypeptidase
MLASLFALALGVAPPTADPDTRAWWATSAALSSDAMEGRDTGSPAHERAARMVARAFAAAGLKPAGEKGSWFQPVTLHEVAVPTARFAVGGAQLRFLHDITLAPFVGMPATIDAAIAYRGYCAADALGDVKGKIVICHGTHRAGLPNEGQRRAAVKAAGAVAYVTIADPGFAVEPPRWPFAYARAIWRADEAPDAESILRLTLNAAALAPVIAGSGQDAAALIAAGARGEALPSFDAPAHLRAAFTITRRDLVSNNVLGLLPGADPAKAGEAIILSAHLDGYGYGEPVDGDRLYNGTLDDAAYVALLIRLAEQRHGKGYKRPILFAAFTGEEKGLLGARHYVAHPTVPLARTAADINLDQLRPIFPLDLLSVHAIGDTTLGDMVTEIAATRGIAVQPDPEPERNLLRRADHWPFLQAGIPATGFIFGYRPGSASERIYRHWYEVGYHRPQDDLAQRIDWKAAADFNAFFYALVDRVANGDKAPAWKPGSALKPR